MELKDAKADARVREGGPGAGAAPFVSVIVPHYSDLSRLEACLAALGRQTYPHDRFEIIVADNASPQGESAVAAAVGGRAKLVVVSEKGAGPARNGGVAASRGEVLAFTDCDCLPEPEWLGEGVRALEQYGIVGGGMRVLVDDPERMTGAEAFETVFAFDNQRYVERNGFTVTANLFCSRSLFDEVGGFRVGLSEDIEWSERAVAAGHRIGYAGAALVGHPARRTWPELVTKWRRLNAETYALALSRPGGRPRWLLRACALPISALAHTPRVLASRKLTPGQKLDALAVLFRLRAWRFVEALHIAVRPR
jgi:GT2 family glycosyltransferase